MGRYGLNGDAHLVLHRVHRESSQNLLTSDTAKWAGRLARPAFPTPPAQHRARTFPGGRGARARLN